MVERDTDTLTGAQLAIELGVPLSVPDAVSKELYVRPVVALDEKQLERLVELLCSGDYLTLL